jgi:endonuclease/exonuclease/phosphatase family metal-dependent hydrolase
MMLERWRRFLGPAVLIASPETGMRGPEPGDSLAVLIWNIDVGAGNFPELLEDELGYSCPPRGGSSHFVILVQEAGRKLADPIPLSDPGAASRRRSHPPNPRGDPDIVEVAQMCGLALAFVPSSRNGIDLEGEASLDKGNAVLSTLPLSDLFAIEHPFETERKVVVGVTVGDGESGILRLINAHLEVTSSFYRIVTTGNRTRLSQALGLLDALALHEARENQPVATLMGGDFNTWTGLDGALQAIREVFPDSPEWDGLDTMGPFPADHIFFRRGGVDDPTIIPGTYRRIPSNHHSDHHPRTIWIRFKGG